MGKLTLVPTERERLVQGLIDGGLTRKQALVALAKADADQDRMIIDPKSGKMTPAPVGKPLIDV